MGKHRDIDEAIANLMKWADRPEWSDEHGSVFDAHLEAVLRREGAAPEKRLPQNSNRPPRAAHGKGEARADRVPTDRHPVAHRSDFEMMKGGSHRNRNSRFGSRTTSGSTRCPPLVTTISRVPSPSTSTRAVPWVR
jgi:hypothetical protein